MTFMKRVSMFGRVVSLYNTPNGHFINVTKDSVPGLYERTRAVVYDSKTIPIRCNDLTKKRGVITNDVYTRAADGSTELKRNGVKSLLPHINFSELVQNFFK